MNTNDSRAPEHAPERDRERDIQRAHDVEREHGIAGTSPDAWSRLGDATIIAGAPPLTRTASGTRTKAVPASQTQPADVATTADEVEGAEVTRTAELAMIVSGPALALAAFAFACAQAFSGFVAAQAATLIPSAADSPANHVRVVAVIYLGLSCAGGLFAWVALRRTAIERSPHWSTYLAAAAIVVSVLVMLQALVLLMLSMLAPANPN